MRPVLPYSFRTPLLVSLALWISLLFLGSAWRPGEAFITREYTIQEVLDACTNVVKGKITSVDTQRQRAKVQVEENLKGKTAFRQININVAVGQQDFPAKLMKKLKVGAPILIFYARKGPKIESLGHTNGTWFQTFAEVQPDPNRTWWNFTHIEIYMHRTYDGDTPGLEQLVRDTLAGKPWPGAPEKALRVLVLTGHGAPPAQGDVPTAGWTTAEFLALRQVRSIQGVPVVYEPTRDRKLTLLEKAHVLWLGLREVIADGRDLLSEDTQRRIRNFARRGGVVIVSGQDSDPDHPGGTGWLPEPLQGVELGTWHDFRVTEEGRPLFQKPHTVRPGQLHLDDSWTGWNKKFRILATSPSGKEIAVAALPYGNGLYLITALYNRDQAQVKANAPLMENLLHYAAEWVQKHSRRSLRS